MSARNSALLFASAFAAVGAMSGCDAQDHNERNEELSSTVLTYKGESLTCYGPRDEIETKVTSCNFHQFYEEHPDLLSVDPTVNTNRWRVAWETVDGEKIPCLVHRKASSNSTVSCDFFHEPTAPVS